MKLWQNKPEEIDDLSRAVEAFTVGNDYITDMVLVPWDCYGTAAHARGLAKIGILSNNELNAIISALKTLLREYESGEFKIKLQDEDCHTAIENYLVEKCGETGKKIHAGRSRNDQVLTATKLYFKSEIYSVLDLALVLVESLVKFGANNKVAWPGYTHMQKAMPSTVELWAGAFAENILDSAHLLLATLDAIDCSPLGSAAGYGVAFNLDREYTAKLLGFDRVQENVIAAQSSRGKNEAAIISAISMLMLDISKLNADLLFFSQKELGYLEIPEKFCTGSSIMPQKKNPDVLELMRAKVKTITALEMEVKSIITDLPSGYNRDLQLTKEPLVRGFQIVKSALIIMNGLVTELKVNPDKCRAAMSSELFAADIANDLVAQGMAFRDAYRKVKDQLNTLSVDNADEFISRKVHTGAPGNPCMSSSAKRHKEILNHLTKMSGDFTAALKGCLS